MRASEASTIIILSMAACVQMRTPPAFTVIGADDVFKVAREHGGRPIGRTLRGIPAVETFQFMKCANQVTLEGEGQ